MYHSRSSLERRKACKIGEASRQRGFLAPSTTSNLRASPLSLRIQDAMSTPFSPFQPPPEDSSPPAALPQRIPLIRTLKINVFALLLLVFIRTVGPFYPAYARLIHALGISRDARGAFETAAVGLLLFNMFQAGQKLRNGRIGKVEVGRMAGQTSTPLKNKMLLQKGSPQVDSQSVLVQLSRSARGSLTLSPRSFTSVARSDPLPHSLHHHRPSSQHPHRRPTTVSRPPASHPVCALATPSQPPTSTQLAPKRLNPNNSPALLIPRPLHRLGSLSSPSWRALKVGDRRCRSR
jgi:hypothetical protein